MNVAAKTVQAGNDQRRLALAAGGQRDGEFRAIGTLAALDLDELVEQFPAAAVEIVLDRLPLRLEAQARAFLLAVLKPSDMK